MSRANRGPHSGLELDERDCRAAVYRWAERGYTRPDGDCELWTRYATHGYGRARLPQGGDVVAVHRIAYVAAHGHDVEPGQVVRHSCGVLLCVNPDHLYASTHSAAISAGNRNRGAA